MQNFQPSVPELFSRLRAPITCESGTTRTGRIEDAIREMGAPTRSLSPRIVCVSSRRCWKTIPASYPHGLDSFDIGRPSPGGSYDLPPLRRPHVVVPGSATSCTQVANESPAHLRIHCVVVVRQWFGVDGYDVVKSQIQPRDSCPKCSAADYSAQLGRKAWLGSRPATHRHRSGRLVPVTYGGYEEGDLRLVIMSECFR